MTDQTAAAHKALRDSRTRAFVSVGSTVEKYQRSAWSPLPEGVSLDSLWHLCGPQVDMHMQRLPLWQVFALVYFEGLCHGSATERKRLESENVRNVSLDG